MNQPPELSSANDWLRKAGARIEGTRPLLPHKFLLVPLTLASEAIVDFRHSKQANDSLKHAVVVALMVRVADSAFYTNLSDLINGANQNQPNICHNCIRGQICGTKMKTLRRDVNRRIIHKMESADIVPMEDLSIVEDYYEEIFKLPLAGDIAFPSRNLELCQKCLPKHKKHNNGFNTDAGKAGAG
jgi:hypothetical protein